MMHDNTLVIEQTLTASGEHDAALSVEEDTDRSRDLQFVSSSPRHFD